MMETGSRFTHYFEKGQYVLSYGDDCLCKQHQFVPLRGLTSATSVSQRRPGLTTALHRVTST